jgi:hypothetical protein
MSLPGVWPQVLDFFGTPLVIEPSPGQLSGDAGLLPIRQFDERVGLTRAFADALEDPRDPDLTEHTFLEMVRARVFGILAGYADQNDLDTLRSDPVFKFLAGRSPADHDLARQPTLSRFENAISIKSLKRLRDVFLDQFIASFDMPPRHLTFDLDAVDDPAHGHQRLTFWHGYYDQNQYLPLVFTCADNDHFVMLSLRPGNVHTALGADDGLEYLGAGNYQSPHRRPRSASIPPTGHTPGCWTRSSAARRAWSSPLSRYTTSIKYRLASAHSIPSPSRSRWPRRRPLPNA